MTIISRRKALPSCFERHRVAYDFTFSGPSGKRFPAPRPGRLTPVVRVVSDKAGYRMVFYASLMPKPQSGPGNPLHHVGRLSSETIVIIAVITEHNQHHRWNRWYEEGPLKGPSTELRLTRRGHRLRETALVPCRSYRLGPGQLPLLVGHSLDAVAPRPRESHRRATMPLHARDGKTLSILTARGGGLTMDLK
jgi:hypothetical protein